MNIKQIIWQVILTFAVVTQLHSQITGEYLYQKNCAVCHGNQLRGNLPQFPSIIDIGSRMNKNEVQELLKTGKGLMPSFKHISNSERQAITDFLFGEDSTSEQQTETTVAELGKSLFIANCAACHKVKEDDPQPKEQRDWGRIPKILGGINSLHSQETFVYYLNMGPCYMPSFEEMKDEDKSAIYHYLSSFEKIGETESDNCQMGCNH